MAQKILEVPYISQHDPEASASRNDCGTVSIAGILKYYGKQVSADEVFRASGAGQGLISIQEMKNAISSFGHETKVYTGVSAQLLKDFIDKDIPVIALVHYGSLNSTQDKQFTGGHFFTVTGYRDDGYFVNDPNFWGAYREHGKNHFYTNAEFDGAWSNSVLDGNKAHSIIVIEPNVKYIENLPVTDFERMVIEGTNFKDAIVDLPEISLSSDKVGEGKKLNIYIKTLYKQYELMRATSQQGTFHNVSDSLPGIIDPLVINTPSSQNGLPNTDDSIWTKDVIDILANLIAKLKGVKS